MKKSVFALLVSSAILLAGCDERIDTNKLLEAEKTIVNLESQLKTAQTELAKLQEESTAYKNLKTEYDTLKSVLEKQQATLPSLEVEIVEVANISEAVKFDKQTQEEFGIESGRLELFASTPKTNVEWLDKLLLNAIFGSEKFNPDSIEALKQYYAEMHKESVGELKENGISELSSVIGSSYRYQRNHLAVFEANYNFYSGGAHGIYDSRVFNVDLKRKKLITLDELIKPNKQREVNEALWQVYMQETKKEGSPLYGLNEWVQREDFEISDNFELSESGVTFLYPVYALGPYAVGSTELFLSWDNQKDTLNREYY